MPHPSKDTAAGAAWAKRTPDIVRQYAGLYLVAVPGRVVVSDADAAAVRLAASRELDCDPRSVVVAAISNPTHWHAHAPVPAHRPRD